MSCCCLFGRCVGFLYACCVLLYYAAWNSDNFLVFSCLFSSLPACILQCLTSASQGGGGWTPDLLLICSSYGSPWLLEMLLTMWTYTGFMLACYLAGFSFSPFVSSGIFDRGERRQTLIRVQMQELLASGEKYHMKMPVTAAVYDRLAQLEDGTGAGVISGSQTLFIGELNNLVQEYHVHSKNGSIHEARYWVVRFVTMVSILNALYFLFIH